MNTYIPIDQPAPTATPSSAAGSTADQYLIFYLGCEEYCIHVPRIREIISLVPLQLTPGLPYCVRGVVSILGKTIPVVDLRLKLGLAEPAPTNRPLKRDPDSTWIVGEYPGGWSGPGFIVMIDIGADPEDRGGASGVNCFGDLLMNFDFAGIIVDRISEIVDILPEDIEPASSAEAGGWLLKSAPGRPACRQTAPWRYIAPFGVSPALKPSTQRI